MRVAYRARQTDMPTLAYNMLGGRPLTGYKNGTIH